MKHFITILLLFLMIDVHAQSRKIDSLSRLIEKAPRDTARVNLIMKKIVFLSRVNLDSAIKLGERTIAEAKALKYENGEVELRKRLAINYCMKGEFAAAKTNLLYLEHAIRPTEDSTNVGSVYGILGMMYGMQSRYDSSIHFYEKAIDIYERSDKQPSAALYSNLSIAYQQQSNFERALFYQQKSLKISEAKNDLFNQAYTILNMAGTYVELNDSVRAEQAYLKAIGLAKKVGTPDVELYAYSNLASLYSTEKKWQPVYEFAMKAAALGGSMGDQGIQSASMAKAAIALAYTNRFQEAMPLARRAIVIADSSAQPLNISETNSTMGTVLRLQGNFKQAIPYFEKALLTQKGSELFIPNTGQAYLELSQCYEQTGDYKKALTAFKTSAEITDSVRRKENIKKATELTMNYEFEKKQQVQQAEQKAKDEVAGARQLVLIVGLGLTLVLAVVAFAGFRNKQRANTLLKQQKEEIESTLTKLKSTQAQLIQSEKMASLGQVTAGIAHEIQNPLNFVNNFSDVNVELIEELQQELSAGKIDDAMAISNDLKGNEQKINSHGKRAGEIVKGMLEHSRSGGGVKAPTDINALVEEYLRLAYHGIRAKDKWFDAAATTNLDQSIGKIDIVPQDIGRVIMNLITNAFYSVNESKKLAAPGYVSAVSVSTKKVDNNVEIRVKDNGTGIPANIVDKIFQPFFTTKPTGQGTGLGLSLSYDIVKAHGGELKVESKEGEGAEFVILLPM